MGDTLARVLGGVAVLGLFGNSLLLWHVDRQVVAVREELGAPAMAAVHRARPPEKVVEPAFRPRAEPGAPREEAKAPLESRQERHEQVASEWRDAALDEVDAWGIEEHLDQNTVDSVIDEILNTAEAMAAIKEDLRAERITMAAARDQVRETKDASAARLDQLVGKDRADALRDRLKDARPF